MNFIRPVPKPSFSYKYVRPGHPDDGMLYSSPSEIKTGVPGSGDAEFYVPFTPPSPPLDEVKEQTIAKINRLAGRARQQFITDVPGQSATYLLKMDEAKSAIAVLAARGNLDPNNYLILAAESIATGIPLDALAREVVQIGGEWHRVAAVIEGLRRGAKVATEAAKTLKDIPDPDSIIWPTP